MNKVLALKTALNPNKITVICQCLTIVFLIINSFFWQVFLSYMYEVPNKQHRANVQYLKLCNEDDGMAQCINF